MASRKMNKKYFFSVEGETELWYLQWLQQQINNSSNADNSVSFDVRIEKNPLKRVKQLSILGKTEIWHLSDYESDSEQHQKEFRTVMDQMKEASTMKNLNYCFGYSNLTFDLWIVLHQQDCLGVLTDRSQYLKHINHAYKTTFQSMTEYKHENNFKSCLAQLSIEHVKKAINRAKEIKRKNEQNGYKLQQYNKYKYYRENPSLDVWIIIEKILKDCKLL